MMDIQKTLDLMRLHADITIYVQKICRTFLEACERVWGRFIIPAEGIILGPAGNSGK